MRGKISAGIAFLVAVLWLAGAAAPLEAANFLWRVTAKNGGQAYILGSIHLAHSGIYPLRDPIMRAFEQAGTLVVEIDTEGLPKGALNGYVAAHGLSKDPRPLPDRLSPTTRQALLLSGFYRPELAGTQPWLAALNIQLAAMRQYGFEPEYGLDKYFIGEARARGLAIRELETLDEQMGMLTTMTDEEADLFLRSVVLEMDDLPETMRAFLDTWNAGDVAGFTRVFFQEYDKYPELTPLLDKIILRRNEAMAAKIDRLLSRRSICFVVVGAGHLVGDQSVLAHLAARGYVVTQL